MTKHTIKDIGLLALGYAKAADEVAHCKRVLQGGYLAWRDTTDCHEYIEKNSAPWVEMMTATAGEYQGLTAAKSRERRAKAKLLRAAANVQARLNHALEG